MLYHFVYKTVHPNGRYYIGRHTTSNIDDGYLGSGVWVSGIKNKSVLKREILEYADSSEHLKILEESYDQLKTRSIMDFIEEVRQEKESQQAIVREAMGTVHAFKKENERLKEQIDMWARMNQAERAPE